MADDHLIQQLLALPLPDRVDLAQALWQSIDERVAPDGADAVRVASAQAKHRNSELASGDVIGRPHKQVMQAARRNLGYR